VKTGPHSFTDATGIEWHIEGYSRVCGAAYVDCRTEDGKALTVRPIAYLAAAGLSDPRGCSAAQAQGHARREEEVAGAGRRHAGCEPGP